MTSRPPLLVYVRAAARVAAAGAGCLSILYTGKRRLRRKKEGGISLEAVSSAGHKAAVLHLVVNCFQSFNVMDNRDTNTNSTNV